MVNFLKNHYIQIFFWFLLIVSLLFISIFNRGLGQTDDGYNLLYSLYPETTIGRITNFGLIGEILLKLSGYNIYFFRLLGFIILLLSSILVCNSVKSFFENRKKKIIFDNKYIVLIISLAGSLCYYKYWIISPSYNMYNLIGALIYISGMCRMGSKEINTKIFISYLLTSFGLILCFISKPPTAFFLSLIFIFWNYAFYYKKFWRNISLLFLIGVSLSFSYIIFFFDSINFFVTDFVIGYELLKTFDPSYGIIGLFIFSIKWIVKYIIVDYWFIYFSQLLLVFIIKNKKVFNFISFIFFLLLILVFQNLNIFLFSMFLHSIFFYKKIIQDKKDYLFVIFLAFIIFFVSFGTNTNIDNHMQHSAILYFLLIIYLFHICFDDSNYKNLLLILILISFTLINLNNNIFNTHRFDQNILYHKYPVKIQKFKGQVYVDKYTKNLKFELDKLIETHNLRRYNYLIDYTGRRPLLNLLTGYEFITRPWWFGGYIGSDKYAKNVLMISNRDDILNSLIIFQKDKSLRKLKIDNFDIININFFNSYELVGDIVVKNNFRKKDLILQLWKPKN